MEGMKCTRTGSALAAALMALALAAAPVLAAGEEETAPGTAPEAETTSASAEEASASEPESEPAAEEAAEATSEAEAEPVSEQEAEPTSEGEAESAAPEQADPAEETEAESAAEEAGLVGGAGMVAYVDPESGQLSERPSAAQQAAIRAALAELVNESSEGLYEEPLPGGGFKVHLQGRFQHAGMISAEPGGELHAVCSDLPSSAERLLTAGAPAAAPAEK